jgi:UDP-N-acetylglucosamine--N-acetylmuramyl-(pentapeptide) pyrophosphoryl-undecaprenol N-acetylglucosamine transferase
LRKLIREFKPSVVFGVGGYASGPAMAAALQLRIPAMAFEPNAMPGLANRLVGKRVQAAAVNFASAARWFRNAEVTGIPVRPEFFTLEAPTAPRRTCSSSAARRARASSILTLPKIPCPAACSARTHRSPPERRAPLRADPGGLRRQRRGPQPLGGAAVSSTICPPALPRPTLVMARSGASTVAELAAAAKPALLVPFAAAADNHQRRNAEEMVKAGAAVLLDETDLDVPGKLLAALTSLLTARSVWPKWPPRPAPRPIPTPPSASPTAWSPSRSCSPVRDPGQSAYGLTILARRGSVKRAAKSGSVYTLCRSG